MPVFALYNFDDTDTTVRDSALGNGAQNGLYLNGAAASGGQAVLDGDNDLVKLYPDPTFQMDRGTLDISFTLGQDPLADTQTVLSRDSAGTTDGCFRVEILADESVLIGPESAGGVETFGVRLQQADELVEAGGALGQVVQGGVRCVALIAVLLAPGASGAVFLGEHLRRVEQVGVGCLLT